MFCLIDMDSKEKGTSVQKYASLKNKYNGKHFVIKKKGIDCHVHFIETRRCLELWFIYYFEYVTRHFASYKDVENFLHKFVSDYEKHEDISVAQEICIRKCWLVVDFLNEL